MNLRLTTLIALAAVGSLSFAQDKKTLRLVLQPGMVFSSTSVTDGKFAMTGPMDQEFKNKTTMTQRFSFEAGTEGWLKFLVATTDFKMEGDDMSMGMGGDVDVAGAVKGVKVAGEVDGRGMTRNVAVSGSDKLDMMTKQTMEGIADRMTQIGLMSMYFPEEAVGVGSKWTKELDLAKTLSAIPFFTNTKGTAPIEFTIEAFEAVDGKDTAKILIFTDGKVTFDLAMGGSGSGSMTMTSRGYVWVDTATGLPVKSETKLANNIDFGMGTMQQEISITATGKVGG